MLKNKKTSTLDLNCLKIKFLCHLICKQVLYIEKLIKIFCKNILIVVPLISSELDSRVVNKIKIFNSLFNLLAQWADDLGVVGKQAAIAYSVLATMAFKIQKLAEKTDRRRAKGSIRVLFFPLNCGNLKHKQYFILLNLIFFT